MLHVTRVYAFLLHAATEQQNKTQFFFFFLHRKFSYQEFSPIFYRKGKLRTADDLIAQIFILK